MLQVFHAEGITEPELADAKRYLAAAQAMHAESPRTRLRDAVHAVAHGQPPGWSHLDLEAVDALTLDDVNAVIRAHFDPADFTMVVVVPSPISSPMR